MKLMTDIVFRLLRAIRQIVLFPLIAKVSQLLLGYDITGINSRLNRITNSLTKTRQILESALDDPHTCWLYQNRSLRMDATVPIFNDARRYFHLARYDLAARFVSGKVVADIACGTGYGVEILVQKGNAKKVIGVDNSRQTIEYAKSRHASSNTIYICSAGDATKIPSESVDVVVSFETLEHVPDDKALLSEFYRILKLGGQLLCSTPNNWPLDSAPHHLRTYDKERFLAVLSNYFEVAEVYNQNSGTDAPFNHGQPEGIKLTTPENEDTAECYIAICFKRTNDVR